MLTVHSGAYQRHSPTVSKRASTVRKNPLVAEKAPTLAKKLPSTIVSKKLDLKRETSIVSKRAASKRCPNSQKNVRNPNHHYFSKKYRNTPPICIAIRLPFVPQYFWCPYALRKGNTVSTPPICIAVRLPFVLQYASHLYRNTFGKILVVVVTGMFPKQFPDSQA